MKISMIVAFLMLLLITAACGPQPSEQAAAIPADTKACSAKDLAISSSSYKKDADTIQGISVSNNSAEQCAIGTSPALVLALKDGFALDPEKYAISYESKKTNTEQLSIEKGGNKVFTVRWVNTCAPVSSQDLSISLLLLDKTTVEIPLDQINVPSCGDAGKKAALQVSDFTSPP